MRQMKNTISDGITSTCAEYIYRVSELCYNPFWNTIGIIQGKTIMRIAICEDERVYLDLIKEKTTDFFREKKVSIATDSFSDATLLLGKIEEGREYDLILMDLQMKHSDGMEIARVLKDRNINVPVIFVTGIENRAYQGYSVDALDYVVKKDMDTRLPEALSRFMEKQKSNTIAVPIKKAVRNDDTRSDGAGFDKETAVIKIKDILWVESDGRSSRLTIKNSDGSNMRMPSKEVHNHNTGITSEEIESPLGIGKLAEMLPTDDFVEIYKAIFVNIREIKRVGNDTVTMSNDRELPLSRRKRNDVLCAVLKKVKGIL